MTQLSVPVLRSGPGRHRAPGRLDTAWQTIWIAAHVPAVALLWMAVEDSSLPQLPAIPVAQIADVPPSGAP
ncbi:hypothetical protein [Streptomyces rugosispiralis]|uniref:Uncharacterized protein n=1 Tax=Streptomyces rugosispiralis TaxID=2967341 RepID=A0ABT1VB62_9ACTN|nr:hypothetical protein [Streptomyces rugosispiralis]MCQ8194633.1 hypothetical protein [Streptomyces rugosispiralis]